MTRMNHEKRNRMSKAGPAFDNFRDGDPTAKKLLREIEKLENRALHSKCLVDLQVENEYLISCQIEFEEIQSRIFEQYVDANLFCKHEMPIMECAFQCRHDDHRDFKPLNDKRLIVKMVRSRTLARISELEATIKATEKYLPKN